MYKEDVGHENLRQSFLTTLKVALYLYTPKGVVTLNRKGHGVFLKTKQGSLPM